MNYDPRNYKVFNVIKHLGKPSEATTIWGWVARAYDQLFVRDIIINGQNFAGFIDVLDYDNHFIYEVPDGIDTRGTPAWMCTCGSFAVLIGSEGYKKDVTPEGLKLACFFRNVLYDQEKGEAWGKHADGST